MDACYYTDTSQHIAPAFYSEYMRSQYFIIEPIVVLSIRIDSEEALPMFCVVKYDSNPLIGEIENESVIYYTGQTQPVLEHYREYKMTPRPVDWG